MITETKEVKNLTKTELISIQTKLKKLNYYHDEIDGIFGKNTAYAWSEFKTDNWLGETTLIGKGSYNLLVEKYRELQGIDWNDFNSKISKYFTVGEVTLRQRQRIPPTVTQRNNCIQLAKLVDAVREDWGAPLVVTSWFRDPITNRRVGGVHNSHHLTGKAVDITPGDGRTAQELENWFRQRWYNTGKWKGGFGLGGRKGFIHLDTHVRRIWNY